METKKSEIIYVVIDDDPTGCQTVYGIDVLLTRDAKAIESCIEKGDHFFILTNSRSMSADEAFSVNAEIAKCLKEHGDHIRIISRSDSTLRGYFKEEIEGISSVYGAFDAVIVAPAFFEGARITRDGTHFLQEGESLIPVDQTEFANDPDFSFSTAYLPDWIEEKMKGAVAADEVITISTEDIERTDQGLDLPKLRNAPKGSYVVVNTGNYQELKYILEAISPLESTGRKYLYRSAASLVKARLGIDDQPYYKPSRRGNRGLIIVGSYVKKTTQQLDYLLANSSACGSIEVSIQAVLDNFSEYQSGVSSTINQMMDEGKSVVVYTERDHWKEKGEKSSLVVHSEVAEFLSTLVSNLRGQPGYIVAKGGITSHDVAAKGLQVTKAKVLGQLMAGVPVWNLYDGKFPSMEYVVFPGNVGGETSLFDAYEKLSGYDND